ncbi:MAG: DUF6054 family protein [Nanoarchaeota archaeon]|mgnify:CR=1 FL=1
MKHAKYIVKGKNIRILPTILKKELKPSFDYISSTGKTYFFVLEKYSLLQNADMSVIILVDIKNETECVVNSVVAGGKVGLFQLDLFDREDSVLSGIKETLNKLANDNGWKIN